jgi:hypothetical protein
MTGGEDNAKRWQVGIWDLLLFTLGVSLSLPAIGVAIKQPLTGVSQFLAYFVGLSILAGSIGALAWRLSFAHRVPCERSGHLHGVGH